MSYVRISEEEFREATPDCFEEFPNPGGELVFFYPVGSFLIKIYSSIIRGESREVGKDAIRVVLYSNQTGNGALSRRIYRVPGWGERMIKVAREFYRLAEKADEVSCRICGAATIPRKSKFGYFLGCSKYPKCRGTISLKILR